MTRRIFRLLAALLVAGALAGGAYAAARYSSGEADSAPEAVAVTPTVPAVSAVLAVVAVPTEQPLPTVLPPPTAEPTLEVVEEAAAAAEEVDTGPPHASTLDVPSPLPEPQPALPPPVDPATLEAAMVSGINAQRSAVGLPPLQLDPDLAMVARERADDMAQKGYFSHVSPTGESFVTLMDRNGIPHALCGENMAYNSFPGDETVAVALAEWMASQAHRDNILSPRFDRVGAGVALDSSGMKYLVVVFAES